MLQRLLTRGRLRREANQLQQSDVQSMSEATEKSHSYYAMTPFRATSPLLYNNTRYNQHLNKQLELKRFLHQSLVFGLVSCN